MTTTRTTARAAQPATTAGTDHGDEAPSPAAGTGRSTNKHPMPIVERRTAAGPTTDLTVTDQHHPAQPATSTPGRYSR